MASESFNQPVPYVEGTPYINWSRGIQQPQPNRAGEILGQGIGKGLSELGSGIREGAQGINAAIEAGLRNDVYAAGDQFMNKEINSLYQEYLGVENKPSEIKNLPNTVSTLANARENGKISQTDHDARLDTLAKELRTRWPSYRPEVDQTLREATGRGSTANQLYESIRGDIDAASAQRQAGRNKVETEIWGAIKEGVPNSAAWLNMYKSGKMDESQVAAKLQSAYSAKYSNLLMENQIKRMQLDKDTKANIADAASRNLSFRLNHAMHDEMSTFMISVHGRDPVSLQQLQTDLEDGKYKLSAEDAINVKQILDGRLAYVQNTVRAQMYKPDEKGQSMASYMGDERYNKDAQAGVEPWKVFSDSIVNDRNFSAAKAVEEGVKAIKTDEEMGNLKDPRVGKLFANIEAINKLGPVASQVGLGTVLSDPNIVPGLRGRLLADKTDMLVPPVVGGYKESLGEKLDRAQQAQVPPAYVKQLVDTVSSIGNHRLPDEAALNIAEAVYGFDAKGVVGKFSTDPNKFGSTDQNEVFKTITAPKITARLAKLGGEVPHVWDNYSNFAESEWYAKSMNDLQDLNKFADNPSFGVKYNLNTHKFDLDIKPYTGMGSQDLVAINRAKQVIGRVNDGITNMSHIYEHNKVDLDAQVIKLLMKSGVKAETITGKMLDAMESQYSSQSGDERE